LTLPLRLHKQKILEQQQQQQRRQGEMLRVPNLGLLV
jgi:hypothetical protein